MRRDFKLSKVDTDFLESRKQDWETVKEGDTQWVIAHGFAIPAAYDRESSSVALLLQASYPDVQIDMAYFNPPLARKDGKEIKALTNQTLAEKVWQRWSRHRVGDDAWRPGVDNIETHLQFVTSFLEEELKKQ